ncbi:MAG TPA: helix-turn-helix transcriptional regulator [Streptosporangiaceae bacterium]|nr:helix-turn-helix transcriptional regulator [Streptosporangiaceae bacterium]
MTDAPPVRRRLLGTALRRFREQAGYTLEDAARMLECDRSKISRIETGQRGVRPKELRELLVEYGVEEPRREALLTIARQVHQAGWWQPYSHALSDAYQDFIGLEASALAIWTYEAQLIPGLLQTEDYAKAIARASLVAESQEEHEQFVKVRLTRQQVLTRDSNPLQFWAILSEGALRQMVGGREVMRAQLAHLVEIGRQRPNVNLQVLPFAAGAHAATSGPFLIMKFPEAPDLGVVYMEGQAGGIYLESADEVARYTLVFEHLRASALSTAATVRLIEEVDRDT